MEQQYLIKSGTATVNNGAKTSSIITCPANSRLFLVAGGISVTVAAAGGGGLVQLVEVSTGTILQSIAVNATQYIPLYFGESGYPATAGNDIQLKVTGAASTEATVQALLVGYAA